MNRREMVLAGLAPAQGDTHEPVEVQKLFFLIDNNIAELVDGPHFAFRPHNYGPFDHQVYEELEALERDGLAEAVPRGTWREYRLTEEGQSQADVLFATLPEAAQEYIGAASAFVRELSFNDLVSAIYRAYPAMRENSIFRD